MVVPFLVADDLQTRGVRNTLMAIEPIGITTLDVIEISALATVGKPVPLGNLGTITLGPANSRGETVVKFTMSRRLVKRIYRRQRPRFDNRRKTDNNDGD